MINLAKMTKEDRQKIKDFEAYIQVRMDETKGLLHEYFLEMSAASGRLKDYKR